MKFKYEIELEITDGLYETGNVVKNICRYKYKHDTKEKQLQDLEKARRNLDILIENFNESIELDEDKTTLEKIEENIADILEDELHIVLGEIGIVVNVEIIEWNW